MSERVDGPETTTVTENQEQLQGLLRDLFQFDAEDLDFGIYRILNQRRDIIEDFIEEDLIETVHEALGEIVEQERHELERELSEAREEVEGLLGEDAFDGDDISEQYRDTPVAEDYIEAKEQLERLEVAEETEARIFNDLYRFFSRFYDRGDFHVKRRFSSQDSKYMVPYNGEEVFFHWANRNQYYVKTSEHFTAYRFDTDNLTVEFTLEKANVPQDNVKGDERYFVLGRDPVSWDDDERELTISFQYRLITEGEADEFVQTYNEATGDDRSSFNYKTNTILCTALQQGILDHIDDDELQRELQREEDGETDLMQHLTRYTSENTMDYFIHKDLGGYLGDELDYYLQNEILETDELVETAADREPTSIRRARVVRQIGERIIEFLDQIESFQQRLFEKRKFVSQTDYMVTLDKVPENLYEEILNNEEQLEQWREVYNTDEWEGDLSWQGEFTEDVLSDNPYLMIDTALFNIGFTHELLSSLDDISDEIDGTLIHGENYQALNLILEKYRGDIDCCYIDPPYNTGSREFLYKDKYKHSSWLSMMEDRLKINQKLLADSGLFFTTIDSNEVSNLRLLCDKIFGSDNFLADISWEKRYTRNNKANLFYSLKDTILTYRVTDSVDKIREPRTEKAKENYRNPDNDPRGPWIDSSYVAPTSHDERPQCVYEIENPHTGETINHPSRAWKFKPEVHQQHIEEDKLYWGENGDFEYPRLKNFLSEMEGMVPVDLWNYEESGTNDAGGNQIKNMFGYEAFDNPKPSKLIRRMIQHTPNRAERGVVLDFFAGSGSTAQAVIEENNQDNGDRDYVLVELDSHFDEVLRPRIQKYIFSSNWSEGVPEDRDGQSHIVKYHRLESYEDALNNVVLEEPTDEEQQTFTQNQRDAYVSGYMLGFESEGASLIEPASFEQPFDHELDIERKGVGREPVAVDLVETFHYLVGADVHQFETYEHQDREYVVTECSVERENGVDSVLTVWRDARDLNLEQEREWVAEELEREQFDQMYINSESAVPRAEPVEVTFKTRMEATNDDTK